MPEDEQDQQDAVEVPETVPGSPEWGGVPRAGGDSADATGGPLTDTGGDVTDADPGEDAGGEAAADAEGGEAAAAEADGGEAAAAEPEAGGDAAEGSGDSTAGSAA